MKKFWMAMVLGLALAAAADAAPRAALFVQNRAGAQLEGQLDAFADLVATRLGEAGFEVIRSQDVLDRFAESRGAQEQADLHQAVEALQTVKSEGTADEPAQASSALRLAQTLNADYLVFAALVSLGENKTSVQAYGTAQQAVTTTLRVALRVLEGGDGAQLYGDTLAVNDKISQNAYVQTQAGDQLNTLLDRGAVELAGRVKGSLEKIEAAKPAAAALASVTINSTVAGAAVELDGVAVGSAPGVFQVRPGVHRMRVTKEGYATWEKSVLLADGQALTIPLEMSAAGIARKGELEEQSRVDDIAREQSAADAKAKVTLAEGEAKKDSESYIRIEGTPQTLNVGDPDGDRRDQINVIQQK